MYSDRLILYPIVPHSSFSTLLKSFIGRNEMSDKFNNINTGVKWGRWLTDLCYLQYMYLSIYLV